MKYRKFVLLGLTAATFGFSSFAYGQSQGIVADFLVTVSGKDTMTGQYALDNQGRLLIRINGMEMITDPVASSVWTVNIAKGVAAQRSLPITGSSGETRTEQTENWKSEFSSPQGNWPTIDPQPTVENLAAKNVNGVASNGKLWRTTIAAGTFGNENAIKIENELWVSEAFGFKIPVLAIMRRDSTEVSRRELRNIRASDFADTYFRPDAAYTIVAED